MQSLYSILQLLAVVFNPAFMGNYAVTVMAFMIAFGKFRMALTWMPIGVNMLHVSHMAQINFEKLVAKYNVGDAHTLAVKYNFHQGYIEMMESYMMESFDNFWLYDHAHIINRVVPVLQMTAIFTMAIYIIWVSPYNQWLLKRRRWDRFIANYGKFTFTRSEDFFIIGLIMFYFAVFAPVVYAAPNETLFEPDIFIVATVTIYFSYLICRTDIKAHRAHAVERYLSE